MTAPATQLELQRLARPLRAGAVLGWSAVALGSGALLLGLAAWTVRLGWLEGPYWVLLAWGAALGSLAVAIRLAWRAQARLSAGGVAGRLEEAGAWRRGTLTALLDHAAGGTSGDLLAFADRAQADDVARRGAAAAEPLARPVRTLGLAGLGVLALGLTAFGSAGPVHGAAAALWHPRRAWDMTVAPVRIRALREIVDRGDSAGLLLEALGRRTATLWLRAPGEGWRPRGVRLDSLGRATVTTGPLQSDVFVRLTSGRRASDTLMIRVRLPVFLGALSVTAHYPEYLGLEAEPVPTGGDTLLLPAGTRLETRGEATARLARAAWTSLGRSADLRVDGGRFSGSFVPGASGEYHLALTTTGGVPLTSDTVRLPIRLVADSAPRVDVPVPGADTLAPLSLQLPLVIDARDDHGITGVVVESRRISRLGLVDSVRRERMTLPTPTTDRAILTYTLDLTRRGLLPGDTVRYLAVASDNTPQRQLGRSREYVLRLPTMSEVRAAQRQASEAVSSRLDSVAAASKQLERQTDDLAQERPRTADGRDEKTGQSLSFEEAKKAEGVAQAQQELVRRAEDLKQSLEALRKSAEAAGLGDSAWQRELSEIREQLERALSPELRQRLQELQQALKDLNAERTQEALERLAEAQKDTREALERSRELFRRAALEGDLANLSKESRDLAQQQHGWNQQVAKTDSARSAQAERELAARADSLGSALDRLGKQVGDEKRQERLDAAGRQAQQAGQEMKQAASASQQGQRQQARQSGERAEQALAPLGDQLQQEREGMQQEWRQEVVRGDRSGAGGDQPPRRGPARGPGGAPRGRRCGQRCTGRAGCHRGGSRAAAPTGTEGRRQERARAARHRRGARGRTAADAAHPRGDRQRDTQRARGGGAGRRRGGRAQRGRVPARARPWRRAELELRLGPRRSTRADGQARAAAGRIGRAGGRPASHGGQRRDPGAAPSTRGAATRPGRGAAKTQGRGRDAGGR